jgi:hypothetical protein
MSERVNQSLIRVSGGDMRNHRVSYSQRRLPYWHMPSSGFRHGPTAGSFEVHTLAIEEVRSSAHSGLSIVHSSLRCSAAVNLVLGSHRNQVDICMWGIPNEIPIELGASDGDEIDIDQGEILHKTQGAFDRRIVLPIHAGTLSVHLAAREWEPRTH